jgi:glucosamine 6-phosphate synthetase-like amidotransferase/phosphosugar isomerase protein
MDSRGFAADLRRKPDSLAGLAEILRLGDPWAGTELTVHDPIVFLGMGSSHYANAVAAARLRARGINAVAELASTDLLPAITPDTVVIAVSASGGSAETLDALRRYDCPDQVIVLTNVLDSPICSIASRVIDMAAGEEVGGVACRSFQHTLAQLLALESHLMGEPMPVALVERASVASASLLDTSDSWLPSLREAMIGPAGTHLVAPARRLSSAQQGALMLREGPRLAAIGCETGDWSHVDVYLTKTTDYRLLLFAGSRWEPELLRWVKERGTTLASVSGDVDGAALSIRYPGDDDDDVRLLTEVLVPELLASTLW